MKYCLYQKYETNELYYIITKQFKKKIILVYSLQNSEKRIEVSIILK